MKKNKSDVQGPSRRRFLAQAPVAIAGATLLKPILGRSAQAKRSAYNILFIFTDQEGRPSDH
jgi:hypothetical protein